MKLRTAFVVVCLLAAGWALYLVGLHHDAVAETLQPGLLCGPEGGCGAVLASDWSTLVGVPVSAPAVPMYLFLAVAALVLPRERVALLAALAGGLGLVLGGWLLYHMLVSVGQVCRYCLVMDGLNILVLVLGVALAPAALRRPRPAPADALLLPVVAAGTLAIALAWPAPQPNADQAVAEALEAVGVHPEVAPVGVEASRTGETKRVVLNHVGGDIPIGPDVPTRGPATAPVTLVLFEDFQCPYCRKLAGSVEALLAERPGDVRVAWYHFPMHSECNATGIKKDMHPRACAAAWAAVCAHRQGRFWEMHDALFEHSARLSDTEIDGYAAEVGLDLTAFRACLSDPETRAKVSKDTEVAASLGVTGTPNSFVNGRKLSGAQPAEALVAVVDALKAATGTERILLDVELRGEVTGEVSAPASVTLDGPHGEFTIDAFEAPAAGVPRPGVEPARGVTWYQASEACQSRGMRLCTEGEWLTACTGEVARDEDGDGDFSDDLSGNPHPYGRWRQPGWCVTERNPDEPGELRTGDHPRCVSASGVYDLEGLTKEWVGLTAGTAGLKGGSYFSGESARCGYFKKDVSPFDADDATGYRCCRGPAPEVVDHHPGGKVGDVLLDFEVETLDGGRLTRADLRGRPAILTFWASWCGPCRKEMPALQALADAHPELLVVGINVDEQLPRARSFLESVAVSFPIGLDPSRVLMARFDAGPVPSTWWIGRDGVIRRRTEGYDESKQRALEVAAEEILR